MRSLPPTGSPIPTIIIMLGVAHHDIRKESGGIAKLPLFIYLYILPVFGGGVHITQ